MGCFIVFWVFDKVNDALSLSPIDTSNLSAENHGNRTKYASILQNVSPHVCYWTATYRILAKTLIHCMSRMNFITREMNK